MKKIFFFICSIIFLLGSNVFSQEKKDSLLNIYHGGEHDTDKVIALQEYIPMLYSSPDSAIKYANISVQLSKKSENIILLAKSHNLLAISYFYTGKLNESLLNLNKALTHYTKLKNKKGIANCYNGIGVVYYDQGKLYKSLEYGIKSLRIKEKLQDKRSISMTLNNIGNVYKDLGKVEKSLEYYNKSIKLNKETENFHGLAMTYNNIGLVYQNEGKYDEAKKYYSESLVIKRQIKDLHGEAMTLNNIGLNFELQKKYNEAIPYYEKSIVIKKQINDQYGLAMSLINLGTVYREKGDYNQCFEKLLESEKINKEIGVTTQLKDCYQRLYETYEMKNNTIQAYKYYKLYIEVKDSLMSEESMKNIENLQAKYENEAKQLTIDNLFKKEKLNNAKLAQNDAELKTKSITNISLIVGLILSIGLIIFFFIAAKQRAKRNETLASSLAEKEVLFKEVHHRVKNNFQVISSLLNLHANNTDNKSVKKALGEAKDRIGSMALVHEKLYQSDDLTRIKMSEYVSQLIEYLIQSFDDNIDVEPVVTVDDFYMNIETAVPLGLIFNELITNSIKYAHTKEENPKIEISIKKEQDLIKVMYQDNGAGLPKDFDLEKLESLGLNLVQILVIQIHGELSIDVEKGACFSFDFKLE
ncbi:MAG: tetratricopeptide repeat protein [Flavobacteriales bacterium]|nr:tetratricopeptide repeat protein [Flavobacteriales bacterium]